MKTFNSSEGDALGNSGVRFIRIGGRVYNSANSGPDYKLRTSFGELSLLGYVVQIVENISSQGSKFSQESL